MRTARSTALVVLAVTGCGGAPKSATKTVTVPARTVTVPETAPDVAASSGASGATAAPGPPLPGGVVGVDGRYLLKAVKSDYDGQDIGSRFFSYEEPSNATTTCSGGTCSIAFRLGLRSGGSKAYTLEADPARQGTYVGTAPGQVACVDDRVVPTRERIAVRAGSTTVVAGRRLAGRLGVYITTTGTCKEGPAKSVVTLRGPRQP